MYSLKDMFLTALLLSVVFAAVFGGRTGKAGALIFVLATALTFLVGGINPSWANTAFGILVVDLACLIALAWLATRSTRYWPIWATGFQLIAVLTHVATMLAPDILPRIYQALATFWAVPILGVMVVGTILDRRPTT